MTRVAMIGAGQRSVSHLAALTHVPNVEVVALADLDETRAQATQQRANDRRAPNSAPIQAPIFADYRRMIETTDPDCVYFCLPPFVHGEIDHALIDFGKPIFFEKPVAVDISVAKEVAAHLREAGIINAAGYQMRYSSAVQIPKALLADQTIGMVISIRLSGLPGTPWWRVQAQSGGMLVEQHTHAVDLMRFLCGEIESVYAVGGTRLLNDTPNLDIFDVNACTVRFVNGAPGMIGNSCAAPEGAAVFPPHLVHVVARDMVLSVNKSQSTIRRAGQAAEELKPEANDDFLMTEAFINAVRSGQASGILSDYHDALQTLAVTLACQQSAEQNRPVMVQELLG